MNAARTRSVIDTARLILELDQALEEVAGNTEEEKRLQNEYEAVCASHGAQLAEAVIDLVREQKDSTDLDEAHVRELHRYLGEWLGRLD